jgi:hypothetical protein
VDDIGFGDVVEQFAQVVVVVAKVVLACCAVEVRGFKPQGINLMNGFGEDPLRKSRDVSKKTLAAFTQYAENTEARCMASKITAFSHTRAAWILDSARALKATASAAS